MFAPFTTTAKEEILSPFPLCCADPAMASCMVNLEKPHQGVASKNPALHQGITWSNSTTALGLRSLAVETRVRSRCTGKERDSESGLDEFGARYYSSSLGRFMIADWAAKPTAVPYANFGNPQSLNLYSYVENNPTTVGDPDGHGCEPDDAMCRGFTLGNAVDSSNGTSADFQGPVESSDAVKKVGAQLAQNATLTTTLSDKGLKFIAKHEGFKGKEYSDIYGNTTVGYGHLVKPGEDFSKGISKKDALKLLSADTKDAESFVNKHLDLYVSQNKFDALVDTAFNSPRAARILINKVNNEEPLWGETFRNTLPHGYNSPPGLLRRRDDEANLYLAGQY